MLQGKKIEPLKRKPGRPKKSASIILTDSTRVYRKLDRDEQLVIFGDPAEGGHSFCSAVATSKKHGDQPIVFNQRVESAQFGYELHKIAKYIERETGIFPEIAVERNVGQATIHVLQTLNYPFMFRMKVFDSHAGAESKKIGWTMTEASRTKMLDDFALAVKQKAVKIYDKDVMAQMMTFVLKRLRSGTWKATAESGRNDDLVISAAGSWQLYLLVPATDFDTFDYDEWKQEQEKWRFR